MAGKGNGGGSTSFESMSHEQMLAWLDQANAGEVQAAADRLTAAAEEIRKIAEELKVRPQWVAWKGEGAEAFRAWANDLANSTHRLGDFSEGAAKWLGQASNAIATAQASIPRDTKGAQANLAAATAAHNDPDAAAIRAKSTDELAALKADQEKVRLEAAAQMRKLGQSYKLSATQMDDLERPKFPPPPKVLVPRDDGEVSVDLARQQAAGSGGTSGGYTGSGSAGTVGEGHGRPASFGSTDAAAPTATVSTTNTVPSTYPHPTANEPATRVGIDSVTVPTEVHQPSTGPTGSGPAIGRPGETGGLPSTSAPVPSFSAGPGRAPSASGGSGKPTVGGRMIGRTGAVPSGSGLVPNRPGQTSVGPVRGRGVTGTGPVPGRNVPGSGAASGRTLPVQGVPPGRSVPSGSGITGGRPVGTPATGRTKGRPPGGPLGSEPTGGRASAGRGSATGQGGQPPARQTGPITGGQMPSAREGVVGGTPQRTDRALARPGTSVPSAPTRGGISGGMPSEASARNGRRGTPGNSTAAGRQRRQKKQTDRRGEPPTAD